MGTGVFRTTEVPVSKVPGFWRAIIVAAIIFLVGGMMIGNDEEAKASRCVQQEK